MTLRYIDIEMEIVIFSSPGDEDTHFYGHWTNGYECTHMFIRVNYHNKVISFTYSFNQSSRNTTRGQEYNYMWITLFICIYKIVWAQLSNHL